MSTSSKGWRHRWSKPTPARRGDTISSVSQTTSAVTEPDHHQQTDESDRVYFFSLEFRNRLLGRGGRCCFLIADPKLLHFFYLRLFGPPVLLFQLCVCRIWVVKYIWSIFEYWCSEEFCRLTCDKISWSLSWILIHRCMSSEMLNGWRIYVGSYTSIYISGSVGVLWIVFDCSIWSSFVEAWLKGFPVLNQRLDQLTLKLRVNMRWPSFEQPLKLGRESFNLLKFLNYCLLCLW